MVLHLILFAKQKDFEVMRQKLSQAYQGKTSFQQDIQEVLSKSEKLVSFTVQFSSSDSIM